jgi:hypothetical protein
MGHLVPSVVGLILYSPGAVVHDKSSFRPDNKLIFAFVAPVFLAAIAAGYPADLLIY